MSRKHKRHEHHEEHMDESWLIPYADLLTLLLALFIVLFASSKIDAKKFDEIRKSFNAAFSGGKSFFENNTPVPSSENIGVDSKGSESKQVEKEKQQQQQQEQREKEQKELQNLQKQVDTYIQQNGLTSQLKTDLNERELKIVISDTALFNSGSADLKPEAKQLAVTISNLLAQYPGYDMTVGGHTDNVPISTAQFKSNWELSTARANSFREVLLTNKKLVPSKFSVIGYGEFRPVDPNDTEAGRAKNRRVEVSIIRKFSDTPPAPQPANG